MNRQIICVLIALLSTFSITSVQSQTKKKELSGIVTTYKNKPIKGARIFVDSLKTKAKTNKYGMYKIMVSPKNKTISVYSANHGVIDIEYTGQDKINFIFPEETTVISKKEFSKMGYGSARYESDEVDYSSYTDIFQLLKSKFPTLQVIGETVRLRNTGTNISGGPQQPLFLVNGSQVSSIAAISPSDIKSIQVLKGNTSLYGSQGAGGIIKIKLKQ